MNKWRKVHLGDIIQFQRGFDITKKEQVEGTVPIVSSSGITSYHNMARVKGPGVIIGRKGTLGKVYYVKSDYWPHDTSLWVKDFKGNCPRFIYYLLKLIRLESYDTGASNPTLNRNHIHKIQLTLPDLPIQEKIAAVLSAYDDLIENNNRRIAILEKTAEEIYREWFVRMRFPGHEKATFHKGIPKDWKSKRFNEFCMLKRGYDLPEDKVNRGTYPVLASTSIKTFHNEFKVEPPVITTGRSGSLGIVIFTNTRAWPLNTTLYVKRFYGNSPYLVFYTLKSMGLENFNAGAGVPTLNRNHLKCINVVVPHRGIQNIFDNYIDAIFKQKEGLDEANIKIKQTRDLLLGRLISGKLSVENLDIQFPPSMEENNA